MHVGPASSASTLAWITYARAVLDRADDVAGTAAVPDDVVRRFSGFLDQWQAAAEQHPEVSWNAEVEADELEFLAHAFLRIAEALAAEADVRGAPSAPPEADEFYQALVQGIVDALAAEDPARAQFSEQLRQAWPGLQEP